MNNVAVIGNGNLTAGRDLINQATYSLKTRIQQTEDDLGAARAVADSYEEELRFQTKEQNKANSPTSFFGWMLFFIAMIGVAGSDFFIHNFGKIAAISLAGFALVCIFGAFSIAKLRIEKIDSYIDELNSRLKKASNDAVELQVKLEYFKNKLADESAN